MRKKEQDPYKNVELSQKDQIIEYVVVGIAGGMLLFFFLKVLFF